MKKNKLLLLVYENDVYHILEVARAFSKKYEIFFLCCDMMSSNTFENPNINIIKNSGIKCKVFRDFRNEVVKINSLKNSNFLSIDWNFLKKIEDDVINKNLLNIIYRDFSFNEVDHHRDDYYRPDNKDLKIKYAEIIIKKLMRILNIKFSLIYSSGQSNFVRNFVYEYSKINQIKFIFPQRRILNISYIEDSELKYLNKNLITKLNKEEKKLLNEFKDYKSLDKSRIKNYRVNYDKSIFLKEVIKIIFSFKNFHNFLRDHLKNRINFFSSNLYYEKNTFEIYYLYLRNAFRKKRIINLISKNSIKFEKIIKKKKYFYFPMHAIPEDGIFNVEEYESQYNLIRKLTKFLPIDYKIVVKPHPLNFQYFSSIEHPSFYSDISKLDNVILLDHRFNHYTLIENSTCVMTFCGSSALEANLYDIDSLLLTSSNYSNLFGMSSFNQKSIADIIKKKNKLKNYFKKNIKYYKFLSKYGVKCDLVNLLFVPKKLSEQAKYKNDIKKLLNRFI